MIFLSSCLPWKQSQDFIKKKKRGPNTNKGLLKNGWIQTSQWILMDHCIKQAPVLSEPFWIIPWPLACHRFLDCTIYTDDPIFNVCLAQTFPCTNHNFKRLIDQLYRKHSNSYFFVKSKFEGFFRFPFSWVGSYKFLMMNQFYLLCYKIWPKLFTSLRIFF